MSHFTVMVVGDVDKQLESFDEDKEVPEYKQYPDEESISRFLNYCKEHLDIEKSLSETITDYFGGVSGGKDEKGYYYMSTYNPKSKWDWYEIGGRWSGFFIKKETGERVDSLLVKEIDFNAMCRDVINEQFPMYHRFLEIVEDRRNIPVWEKFITEYPSVEEARVAFFNHPIVKKLSEDSLLNKYSCFVHSIIEQFNCSEEELLEKLKYQSFVSYAYVKDFEWHQRGDMGWWGMSSNEKEPKDWNTEFAQMIQSLDPEETISLVDCHI